MKKLVLIAPVFALALTACAHDPRVAAKVDGQSIPISDVTIFANFLCVNSAQSSSSQVTPMSVVDQSAMTYLAGAKAVEVLARDKHVSVPTSSVAVPTIAKMPTGQQARAQQLVNEVSNAIRALGLPTGTDPSPYLVAAIHEMQVKGTFVENPAYPVLNQNSIASGSLSAAVSSAAKASVSEQPGTPYIAGLPTSQKCG